MSNHCYICNEPSISDEHIPPQCLFPESKDLPSGFNFRKNLITVPSCAEHNLRKSGDDEYLLFVLVSNFNVNSVGLHHWRTKIRRAMQKRPSKRGIFHNPQRVQYQGKETGAYSIDFERLKRQFDFICRGIYFFHFNEPWNHDIDLVIPFALSRASGQNQKYNQAMTKLINLVSQSLEHESVLGENPEVFYYQYKLKAESPGFMMKMVFYNGIEVAAISESKDKGLQ